jgi:hypothetical protein
MYQVLFTTSGCMASITLNIQLKLEGVTVNTCPADMQEITNRGIVNHALITMGKHMTHWEGKIKDGMLSVDNHTFKPIPRGDSYEDELGVNDLMKEKNQVPPTNEMVESGLDFAGVDHAKISDYVILWLYKTHLERKILPKSSNPTKFASWQSTSGTKRKAPSQTTEEDPVNRVYFVGAVALSLLELMKASIATGKPASFHVQHNFVSTSVRCTVVPETNHSTQVITKTEVARLDTWIKNYLAVSEEI